MKPARAGTEEGQPTLRDVTAMVQTSLGQSVASATRFPTGLHHFVYDVITMEGTDLVVRVATSAQRHALAEGVRLSSELRPRGVPLPKLLGADLDMTQHPFPFMVLERLPGTDLGRVYSTLQLDQKHAIARRVVRAQEVVATLPPGQGYGFATSADSPLEPDWAAVVAQSLSRARARINTARVVDASLVDRVGEAANRFSTYFDALPAVPFLHDTTTKNVLVHNGRFSGIVDVDSLCYGDPLYTPALTRAALLGSGLNPDYVEISWCDALGLDREQQGALDFYTALFCVDLLGEVGQCFGNQAEPLRAEQQRVHRLTQAINHFLARA